MSGKNKRQEQFAGKDRYQFSGKANPRINHGVFYSKKPPLKTRGLF